MIKNIGDYHHFNPNIDRILNIARRDSKFNDYSVFEMVGEVECFIDPKEYEEYLKHVKHYIGDKSDISNPSILIFKNVDWYIDDDLKTSWALHHVLKGDFTISFIDENGQEQDYSFKRGDTFIMNVNVKGKHRVSTINNVITLSHDYN